MMDIPPGTSGNKPERSKHSQTSRKRAVRASSSSSYSSDSSTGRSRRQKRSRRKHRSRKSSSSPRSSYSSASYHNQRSRRSERGSVPSQVLELASIVKDLATVAKNKVAEFPVPSFQQAVSAHAFRGDAIPTFSAEEPNQRIDRWLEQIDELRQVFKWSEETTIYNALGKLRGLASTWYRGLPSVKFTWTEWKQKLIRAFPSKKDYCAQLEEMLRRKKRSDETMSKYFYEKCAMVSSCKIEGKDAVSCIIGGLADEHLQQVARAGDYPDPEALFEYLRTCKDYPSPRTWHTQNRDRKRKFSGSSSYQKNRPEKERQPIRCYRCNALGHIASRCTASVPRLDQKGKNNDKRPREGETAL